MHDVILRQVVQRYEYLNGEALDEIEREALEVVHLDEFIKIDGQHFESDHEMLPEVKLVQSANYVLLVLGVLVVQVLYQFCFHKALLVQSFLIL